MRFLPRINKKKTNDIRFSEGSYSHLRDKQKKRGSRMSAIRLLPKNYRFNYSSIIILLLIILLVGFLYLMFFGSLFSVQKIEFEGNVSAEIRNYTEEKYSGENLTRLSVTDVENGIVSEFSLADKVFVRKVFPSTIRITVDEITVSAIFLSFDTVGVFDSEYEVHNLEEVETPISLNEYQLGWLKGSINADSEYVQKRYLETLSETEIAEFDWDEVAPEQKQAILDQLAFETSSVINQYFESGTGMVWDDYGEVPLIKIYEFTNGDTIERLRTEFTVNALNFINENTELNIVEILWESDIRLKLVTEERTKLLFGTYLESSSEEQLDRFLSLYDTNRIIPDASYDFRSETFTVQN